MRWKRLTKRRILFLSILLIAVFGLMGVAVILLSPFDKPGVTIGAYRKIEVGMTRSEVDALLGGQPISTVRVIGATPPIPPSDLWAAWKDEKATIQVFFLKDKVTYKHWLQTPSTIEHFLSRLGIF